MSAKTKTAAAAPDPAKLDHEALQAAHGALNEIRTARVEGGAIAAERSAALHDLRDADEGRMAALEARARGEDWEDAFADADARKLDASSRVAASDDAAEAVQRVVRGAQARITYLRTLHYDAFQAVAEQAVDEARTSAEALVAPLRALREAYVRASSEYARLGAATAEHIMETERAGGRHVSQETIRIRAEVPECPVSEDMIRAVIEVLPRPRYFDERQPLEMQVTDAAAPTLATDA